MMACKRTIFLLLLLVLIVGAADYRYYSIVEDQRLQDAVAEGQNKGDDHVIQINVSVPFYCSTDSPGKQQEEA